MADLNTKEFNTLDIATRLRDQHHGAGAVSGEFANLSEFENHALSAAWSPTQTRIHVADIPYRLIEDKKIDWVKALRREVPLCVIYAQPHGAWRDEGKKTGLGEWIVIVWRKTNGNIMKPSTVFTTNKQVYTKRIKEFGPEHEPAQYAHLPSGGVSRTIGVNEAVDEDKLIGATAMIKVTSLPQSKEMKARVDTGATLSSIHCDRWKVNGESVEFVSKELSPNVITLPLVTHQATRTSDGGTENRPVVELNVRINGNVVLQGMQFNLNNRQHMEYPVLIGQNILQKGKFLIDPSMVSEEFNDDDYEIDWDSLMEEIEPMLAESAETTDKREAIDTLVDVMMNSDLTFKEIVQQCRRLEYAGNDK